MTGSKLIAKLLKFKDFRCAGIVFRRGWRLDVLVKPYKNGCRCPRCGRRGASGYRHLDAFSDMIYLAAGDLDLPEQIPARFRTLRKWQNTLSDRILEKIKPLRNPDIAQNMTRKIADCFLQHRAAK